jgi:mannose-6-phosphate isomerase-like protein (cupin superfamily)
MLTVIRIDRWDPRRDGPMTETSLRRKVESYGYQVSIYIWPGGTVVPAKAEDRARLDAVVSGIVKITLDGESAILTAGDIAHVPRGAVRRVEVIGSVPARCIGAVNAHARSNPAEVT